MTKKEFALAQIAPYYHNPELCGYEGGLCQYKTTDGRMCVAGKNLQRPGAYRAISIIEILLKNGERALKPESRGLLDLTEWLFLQRLHDNIAKGFSIWHNLNEDGPTLFTFEELQNYKPE